ncbi:MAG: hypothetical protein Q7S37_04515 [bacterium]|nr:hypothetical protein [bacterium]
MTRKAIREFVTVGDVMEHSAGWFADVLYDADSAIKQEYLEKDKGMKRFLYLIYPILTESKK